MKKKIFVSGVNGFQGSNIARQFINHGAEVVSLSARPQQLALPNTTVVPGGFQDSTALQRALKDVEVAVFTFPLRFDMELALQYTSNFIASAEQQQVPLVIFNAGFDVPKERTGYLGVDIKFEIQALFEQSRLNVVTLVPDIYLDNLAAPWSIPVVLQNGILPYPIAAGTQVPWISHLDLAKYVVAAADQPALAGSILPIGGQLYTGEEIAHAITAKLNQEVQFVSIQPDDFEKQLTQGFGAVAAKEISNLYRYVAQRQNELKAKDFAGTQRQLSVQNQSLEDWVNAVTWELPTN